MKYTVKTKTASILGIMIFFLTSISVSIAATSPPTLQSPSDGTTLEDCNPDLVWSKDGASVDCFYIQISSISRLFINHKRIKP